MCVCVAQPRTTVCNPTDCSPPGFSVHGFLQARILEWVAMPSSRGSSQPRIEPRSPALQADSLKSEPPGNPKKTNISHSILNSALGDFQGFLSSPLTSFWLIIKGKMKSILWHTIQSRVATDDNATAFPRCSPHPQTLRSQVLWPQPV